MKLLILFLAIFLPFAGLTNPCDSIEVYIKATDTLLCEGDAVYLEAVVEGTDNYTQYIWNTVETSKSIEIVADKDKTIQLKAYVSGCPEPFEDEINISVVDFNRAVSFKSFRFFFEYRYNYPNEINSQFDIYGNGTKCDTCYYEVNNETIALKDTGSYAVVYTHRKKGCIDFDTFSLQVDEIYQLDPYIPNVVVPSPNNMSNAQFRPYNAWLTDYEISIYSRRGNRIFHCDQPDCFWNGRNEKGEILPSDSYFYMIRIKDILGEVRLYRGTVFILN